MRRVTFTAVGSKACCPISVVHRLQIFLSAFYTERVRLVIKRSCQLNREPSSVRRKCLHRIPCCLPSLPRSPLLLFPPWPLRQNAVPQAALDVLHSAGRLGQVGDSWQVLGSWQAGGKCDCTACPLFCGCALNLCTFSTSAPFFVLSRLKKSPESILLTYLPSTPPERHGEGEAEAGAEPAAAWLASGPGERIAAV